RERIDRQHQEGADQCPEQPEIGAAIPPQYLALGQLPHQRTILDDRTEWSFHARHALLLPMTRRHMPPQATVASRALFRSNRRSSTSSTPTLNRTSASLIPSCS